VSLSWRKYRALRWASSKLLKLVRVESRAAGSISPVTDSSEVDTRIRGLLAAGYPHAAAEVALRSLGPGFFQYVRALAPDEAEAADAYSALAESLVGELPALPRDISLRSWALRLATREAFDVRASPWCRRTRRVTSRRAADLAGRVRLGFEIPVGERHPTLDRLRRELSLEDQALVALRVDQQLSWLEVPVVLVGSSAGAEPVELSMLLERAKERLVKAARREGLIE
jgi:RNA polymerase sigma-70 factor, ECF subfamily